MQKCLIISFDFPKSEYPKTSYAIACILARFHKKDIVDIEHYQYDLNPYLSIPKGQIELKISSDFKEKYLQKINDYSFVALSAYAWSENLVNLIVDAIHPIFEGKIILGGYEVTALNEEKLSEVYPNVDFYLKGYVEKSLELIFQNTNSNKKVVNEKPEYNDFVSPYLSGTISLNTKKIHWESKRGCPYHCDFCEYGNAANNSIVRIDEDRIDKEIELFKQNNIQEINVLDATFLVQEKDNEILEKLLSISNCKICLQMHFSTVNINSAKGSKFLDICQQYKDRISLEFGLQTIHEEEMKVLNRKNNIERVKTIMKELNEREINYEISIIFGIPKQTVDSFEKTIKFIEDNGCKKFCSFPLRLPQNSKMAERKNELKIKEIYGEHFSLDFVSESITFNQSEWEKMYILTALREDKPPFCGDPTEGMRPIIDKITGDYVFGGLHCRLNSDRTNNNISIFGL